MSSAFGQNFQGIAIYQKLKIMDYSVYEKNPDKRQLNAIKNLNKKNNTRHYKLTFNSRASIYKESATLKNQTSFDKIHKNIKTKNYLEQIELYGKWFSIKDPLINFKWKTTSETKRIGKHLCYKAIGEFSYIPKSSTNYSALGKAIDTTSQKTSIEAWYTLDVPVNHGPDIFWGLPGLILELHQGDIKFVCTEITLYKKDQEEINLPKKGTEITRKKFEILRNKKIKERNKMWHGGGRN